jgi:RNA polymerase sigma factor (sigma-70 family)
VKDIEIYYKRHGRQVYCFLMSMAHNQNLAEELTQETFYQAMKSIKNYRGECKPSVWLCQIAKHVWCHYLEKNKKENFMNIDEIQSEILRYGSAEDEIIKRQEKLYLYKKIQLLNETMRDVIYLRLASDLSFMEIGEIMGKSETWARVTYYRAKNKLMGGENK